MLIHMKNLSKEEKTSWILFITAWVIYAVVSMTKSAYAATMASIIGEGLFDKTAAGTVNASFYLFYGSAQLLGVKVVDKVSPVKLVSMTLAGTLVAIIGMAVSKSFLMMLIFWSFCGLVQFAIWPAVLRIIAEYLVPSQKSKAMVYIAFSYCTGMLANYLAASVVLGVAKWRTLFWVFAVILSLSIVLWQVITSKTKETYTELVKRNREKINEENEQKNLNKQDSIGFFRLTAISGILILLVPSLIRTAMDAGLKSWVPTMITENYDVSASFASMLTSILVFVNLGGVYIANWMYPKRTKNAAWAFGICFLTALPFTVMLLLTGRIPVGAVVFLLTAITTMMYAGHQLINVIIPTYFSKYNRTGSIAALLNALASFGAVAANIGFGYLAENFGWSATITAWIILAVVSFVACAIASPVWKKFTKGTGEEK